jgi:NAD(P)-dependent dehydrogenase (short-subunit alcohol dehydrogenase family)
MPVWRWTWPLPSKTDPQVWRDTYEVNVLGPILVTQAMLPLLRAGKGRVIVNVTSELGSLALNGYPGFPFAAANAFAYSSSKTALNMFTVMLAKELSVEGFRVNAVNPGFTDTDLNRHTGPQPASEAAALILRYAMLSPDGPNGGFFTKSGTVPW